MEEGRGTPNPLRQGALETVGVDPGFLHRGGGRALGQFDLEPLLPFPNLHQDTYRRVAVGSEGVLYLPGQRLVIGVRSLSSVLLHA